MFQNLQKNVAMIVLALTAVICLGAATGCDLYGMSGRGGYGNLFGGYGGYGFPDATLYDSYYDIQSVIDYRQDVMDWSNDGWDAYIRG